MRRARAPTSVAIAVFTFAVSAGVIAHLGGARCAGAPGDAHSRPRRVPPPWRLRAPQGTVSSLAPPFAGLPAGPGLLLHALEFLRQAHRLVIAGLQRIERPAGRCRFPRVALLLAAFHSRTCFSASSRAQP